MKVKTSIILPHALLREIDRRRDGQKRSRSAFIEEAVRAFSPAPIARHAKSASPRCSERMPRR